LLLAAERITQGPVAYKVSDEVDKKKKLCLLKKTLKNFPSRKKMIDNFSNYFASVLN